MDHSLHNRAIKKIAPFDVMQHFMNLQQFWHYTVSDAASDSR